MTATPETQAEASSEAAPTRPQRRISWNLIVRTGTVLGLLATAVGLFFKFFPGLDPGHGSAAVAPPTLAIAKVNPAATLREGLIAEGIDPGDLSPRALAHMGVLASMAFSASGYAGKELPLDVVLTDRASGRTACSHRYGVHTAGAASATFRAWVPFPAQERGPSRAYVLHVTLRRPDAKPPELASGDSDPIAGPAGTTRNDAAAAALC